jgi:hypothetical protein
LTRCDHRKLTTPCVDKSRLHSRWLVPLFRMILGF